MQHKQVTLWLLMLALSAALGLLAAEGLAEGLLPNLVGNLSHR